MRSDAVGTPSLHPSGAPSVPELLDDAPRSGFHRRTVAISGMGFFTDAYDLFVIATVAALVQAEWHLSTTQVSLVTGAAILGAFLGASVFGRIADVHGRKAVYVAVAVVMILGAVASSLATSLWFLVAARFVLGLGIGGDYPVSAVLMSEYANRTDRGRLVSLVFSMQALGLIVGPLVAVLLLASGVSHELTWRILLGLGAVPAASIVVLRTKMPESPRFRSLVLGDSAGAATDLATYASGAVVVDRARPDRATRLGLRRVLSDPRMRRLVVATAGSWFLFDYAYYGNTLSLPSILTRLSSTASTEQKLLWSLAMFVAFALPGYVLAVARIDRVGHRRLQLLGFAAMAGCFALLAAVPSFTASLAPFLAIFGVSYFFIEFGPNVTTFVLPSEVFPVSVRTTGHGLAAGIGKLGAFIGVFLVPVLQDHLGLRGMLAVAAGSAVAGLAVSRLLPEPTGQTLEDVSDRRFELLLEGLVGDARTLAPASAAADSAL